MAYHGVTDIFRTKLLEGSHKFGTDVFKLALYTAALDQTITDYTTTNETTGSGYTAGGAVISVTTGYPQLVGGRAEIRFDPVVWATGTFMASHGLIYNATNGTDAVFIMDFGQTFVATGGMTVQVQTTSPALIRI